MTTTRLATLALLTLTACEAPFAAGTGVVDHPDSGDGGAAEAAMDDGPAGDAGQDAGQDATPDHDGGADSAPTGPDGEAGAPGEAGPDAPPDAPPPVCVTDLSGVGTGDFHISFTLTTTTTGLVVALVNQRAGCDTASTWWDVTLTPSGGIELATDDGSGASYVFVESGNSVNDGAPHAIVVARTNGAIWYSRDGVVGSSLTPDTYAFGAFPALTLGTSGCAGTVPLSGHGTLSNLCITRP